MYSIGTLFVGISIFIDTCHFESRLLSVHQSPDNPSARPTVRPIRLSARLTLYKTTRTSLRIMYTPPLEDILDGQRHHIPQPPVTLITLKNACIRIKFAGATSWLDAT